MSTRSMRGRDVDDGPLLAEGGSVLPSPTIPAVIKDKNLCGKCDVVVGPYKLALNCDIICKVWFHIVCQKFPEAVYWFMVDKKEGKQLGWKCCFCQKGYENLHTYMKEIEGQQAKLLARQDALEVEIQEIKGSVKDEMVKAICVEQRLANVEGKILVLEEQNISGQNDYAQIESKIQQGIADYFNKSQEVKKTFSAAVKEAIGNTNDINAVVQTKINDAMGQAGINSSVTDTRKEIRQLN